MFTPAVNWVTVSFGAVKSNKRVGASGHHTPLDFITAQDAESRLIENCIS